MWLGKDGLEKRLKQWYPSDVDKNKAQRAKDILQQMNFDQVKAGSWGISLFYTWVRIIPKIVI